MARVSVFQGGNVQSQGTTNARHRAANFGESAVGAGLQTLGKVGAEAVDKLDQLADISARVETNKLSVEHSEITRSIGQRVKQSLGENAEGAAAAGVEELNKATSEIIGRASPRAKMLLESELRQRTVSATDGWLTHGFSQKADAFESSSIARIKSVVEDAADTDDEDAGLALLNEVGEINSRRASFFGKGEDWAKAETFKERSGYFTSRAMKLATNLGENGGAHAAIQYVTKNRANMSDDDYNKIVNAYDDEAIKDWAFAKANGYDPTIIGVVEHKATPATAAEAVDPLHPLPEGAVQQTADGKPVVAARADHAAVFANLIVPNEGTTYTVDNNGAGVKYGINAAYNPGVDVKNLTQAQAAAIFKQKYWDEAGCNTLPPQLAAMHADTYYLNPSQAKRILRDSGGDPDKYMELRRGFLAGLHASNPAKYPDYESRNKRVEQYADRLGDGGALPQIDVKVNMSVESIKDKVFQTPGVGMRLKRAYYSALVEQRNGLRQQREEQESEVSRALTMAVLPLGDNFTSLTQLDPRMVAAASPSTLTTLSNMAKNNKESRPLPLNVQAQVAYTTAANPTAFLDPKVQQSFIRSGGTTKQLGELVQSAASAAGKQDSLKPDPVPPAEMERAVRTVMEARGLPNLWGIDASDKKPKPADKAAETKEDARQQLALMGLLNEASRTWAVNNPGKRAGPEIVNGWISHALKHSTTDPNRRAYDMQFTDIYRDINPYVRSNLIASLKRNGIDRPSQGDVVRAYREGVFLGRIR